MKFLLALTTLAALAASSSAFLVNSDGSVVTINVSPGTYRVFASGQYSYDYHYGWSIADPEWMMLSDNAWHEYSPLDPSQKICDLSINETFFDWRGLQPGGEYLAHSYSATHEYMVEVYLSGETQFQIYDPLYWTDNSGSLEVTLTPVPEPATMSVLGLGLLAFIKRRR